MYYITYKSLAIIIQIAYTHAQNKTKKTLNGGTATAVPAVAVPPAMVWVNGRQT